MSKEQLRIKAYISFLVMELFFLGMISTIIGIVSGELSLITVLLVLVMFFCWDIWYDKFQYNSYLYYLKESWDAAQGRDETSSKD